MRLLPRSLFGRLVLLLLSGLILAQLLSAFILLRDRGQALYESLGENLIERTAGIVHLLDSLPPSQRRQLLPLLGGPKLRIRLDHRPLPLPPGEDASPALAERIRQQLAQRLAGEREVRVALRGGLIDRPMIPMHRRMMQGPAMGGPMAYMQGLHAMARLFLIQVKLEDGSWAIFERGVSESSFHWPSRLLVILAVLLISVLLLSLVGVRSIVRPLRDLQRAAEGLGRDIRRPPLPERGPEEVRETARAFNTMQARLQNYLEDRARILAAVSHDLKTPLTRIRLRTDLMDDGELRRKIQQDLDDMEAMVGATLDFMRGTGSGEQSQPLDLPALLESIAEDFRESGARVRLACEPMPPYLGRPLALKRCIVNLVENALRYGGEADIRLQPADHEVTVTICDRGPGIPEQELERVFEPFYRLEASRSQHTGGTGLGLGIARNIARAHGGDLTLRNRPEGGLCARLSLPR